jgi:hypothetical protein
MGALTDHPSACPRNGRVRTARRHRMYRHPGRAAVAVFTMGRPHGGDPVLCLSQRHFLPSSPKMPTRPSALLGDAGTIAKGPHMCGQHHQLTRLRVRKLLLIAESELNRAQLVDEIGDLSLAIPTSSKQPRSIVSFLSASVVLVAEMALRLRTRPDRRTDMPTWLHALFMGFQVLRPFWTAWTSRRHHRNSA